MLKVKQILLLPADLAWLLSTETDRNQFYSSYAQIYLHRDIRDRARDVDVAPNIAKSFQTFGIIYLSESYHTNVTIRNTDNLGSVFCCF